MSRFNRLATLLLLAATSACADGASPLAPEPSSGPEAAPAFTIFDSGHAGASANLKFWFLPPMVENFNDDKKSTDGTLSPVVEVCELTSAGLCGKLIERFTVSGGTKTNEKVRWLGNHYHVNFRAGSYSLNSSKKYRVTVLVNNLVMGWADAMFAREGDRRTGSHGECRDRDDDRGGRRHSSYSQSGFQQNGGGWSNHYDDRDRDGHGGRDDDDRDGRGGRDDDDRHDRDHDDRDGHGGRDRDRDGHGGRDRDRDHDHDGHGHHGGGHDDDDDHCSPGVQQYVILSCNETLPIKFRIGLNIAGSISLNPPTRTVSPGTPVQYVATVKNLKNVPITVPITWTSSDPTIATVGPTGLVTTLRPGTVTITAKAERVSATATLTVTQLVVRVDVTSVTMGVGGMRTMTATAYDAAGNVVTGQPVSWTIVNGDGTIAQITGMSGIATGLAPGVAVATATIAGVSGTGTATVTPDVDLTTICTSAGLGLYGVTTILPTGACGVRLTPSELWTSGAAWSTSKQTVVNGFEARFSMRMSNPGPPDLLVQGNTEPGADGIVFVIQNMSATAIGAQGIGLGYQGLTSSVAIEFDTWLNPGEGDPSGNHVSIHTGGLGANSADETYSIGSVVIPTDWYDDQVHEVVITYVPGTISVSIDGVTVLTAPLTLTNVGGSSIVDANGKMWAGFTSATGGAFGTHDILSWRMTATAP